jgi:hypothetical protein
VTRVSYYRNPAKRVWYKGTTMKGKQPYTLDSIANICAAAQASYAEVTRVIEAVNARPAVVFNGAQLFDGPTTERIIEEIRESREARTRR